MADRARGSASAAAPISNSRHEALQGVDRVPFLEPRANCDALGGACNDEEEGVLQADNAAEDGRYSNSFRLPRRLAAGGLLLGTLAGAAAALMKPLEDGAHRIRATSLAQAAAPSADSRGAAGAPVPGNVETPRIRAVIRGLAGASCAAYGCGTPFDAGHECQCNDECGAHNSCCSDFKEVCSGVSGEAEKGGEADSSGREGDPDASCAKFGCIGFVKENPCQCMAGCHDRGDCCHDYDGLCGAPVDELPADEPAPPADAPQEGGGSCNDFGCTVDFEPANPCQCNMDCAEHNSCCPDFHDICSVADTHAPAEPSPPEMQNPAPHDASGTCSTYGCIEYDAAHACQCNPDCEKYNSCCEDYVAACAASQAQESLPLPRPQTLPDRAGGDTSGPAAPVAGGDAQQVGDGATHSDAEAESPLEKIVDFPEEVVDNDYQTACEAGNGLGGGWMYIYNAGRGTDSAACGTQADYWCCRRCVNKRGCTEVSASTTSEEDASGSDEDAVGGKEQQEHEKPHPQQRQHPKPPTPPPTVDTTSSTSEDPEEDIALR